MYQFRLGGVLYQNKKHNNFEVEHLESHEIRLCAQLDLGTKPGITLNESVHHKVSFRT